MQVWLTACGKTASIASGKPERPSVQTKSTSLTPRLRRSVSTLVQKRARSLFSIHRPRQPRVQVDDDVDLLERPGLPGADVFLDRAGHLRDQPLGDVDAVQLAQVPLDLARGHPARVQREDLLVEAVERARVLGHNPRLERVVTITRQLDPDRPIDRPQRLLRQPVAPVRLTLERLATRRVAEMLLQLGAGRPLDQPLAQPIDQPLRAGQLLRPLILPEQLIDQLVRDLHVAHHGPPSGPPDGIAPTAATPRSSRPRRTNQSDTQKPAHYPRRRG